MGIVSYLVSLFTISITIAATMTVSAGAATTYPGSNGAIAYSKNTNNVSSIWSLEADGSRRQLEGQGASMPRWSPKGHALAFMRQDSLFIRFATGELKKVAIGKITDISWSTDGSQLTFVRQKAPHDRFESAIFTIRVDGTQEVNQTGWRQQLLYSPSFSPDGTRLVYAEKMGTKGWLNIKNLAMNHTRLLTKLSEGIFTPTVSWSLQGQKILFTDSANELYTIWADGSRRAVISDGESYGGSWSPDGREIAFYEDKNDTTVSISQANGDIRYISVPVEPTDELQSVQWSPDGAKLLLAIGDTVTHKTTVYGVDSTTGQSSKQFVGQGTIEMSWRAR